MDLQPCNGAPFLISKVHFLDADPELIKNVDGLKPNRSLHDIRIQFESLVGRPLQARNRIQINVDMEPAENYQANFLIHYFMISYNQPSNSR
jgi:hypothetical protein